MATTDMMRAAVLNEPGDLEVREVPVPEPGPSEVLVRIRACGVCGSDLKIRDHGWLQDGAEYPLIIGHEWTGEVVELGPEASAFDVGDRVADETHHGCGHCRNCKTGRYTACLNYGRTDAGHRHYGFTTDGGYATYCTIAERNLHRLPAELSYVDGTLATTTACSLYGVERAGVEAGDFVAVIGPGTVGLTAVQCAKLRGATEVVLTGTRDERLRLGTRVGADHTVNVHAADPVEAVFELTDGQGADVVLESAGTHETVRQAIEMVRPAGRVGLIGNPGDGLSSIPAQRIVNLDLDVLGVKAQGRNATDRALRLMATPAFDASSLITHEFDLADIHEAMAVFEERRDGAVKVVVSI
jgi:L-iditol 2-dehydrogenase